MYNPWNAPIVGEYFTRSFSEIFPDAITFRDEYTASGLYDPDNTVQKLDLLYYLLYARYGNSTVASLDENRFKYDLYSIIFQYGPAWETKLKVQKKVRDLENDDALFSGSVNINNHSFNPSTDPAVNAFDPLTTINDQTATKWEKAKIEGYAQLMAVLKNDVSEWFLDKFKRLFIINVAPNAPLVYSTTPEEQEILGL